MLKELVVISGKGGTGKSSIVSSLATLAKNKIVVDCDVDAADLHLIFDPNIVKTTDFFASKKAKINKDKCIGCNRCVQVCKFEAVLPDFKIDELKCEGCGACFYQCPSGAIEFEDTKSGQWFESDTRFGKLIHAKLGIAEENSGKLVSQIKNYAKSLANKNGQDLILVDGSPGIGCPVIASISGANMVLIVIEPTLSGIHDAKRVLKLTKHFNIPTCICINKFDINLDMTKGMETFCKEENIEIVGKVPYSKDFTYAMIEGKSLIEFSPEGEISETIKIIWKNIEKKL